MTGLAIRFDRVSKSYRLRPRSFRTAWRARLGMTGEAADSAETLWALRDVSFDVAPGEVLGLIGSNGAGKSTVLKLMAGVTSPTHGSLALAGRVGSLIELGAGFHPELTGRDNVYLNGQIMGLRRRDVARRYDEIVAFAGLDDFMDVPVKRYSSGMYARLGFAVAAHLDPDVLLVDEVLSVGDAAFQRKSLERMLQLVRGGKTVIFVSHNLLAVERLCHRVIWLDHGRVQTDAAAREAIQVYLQHEEQRFVQTRVEIRAKNDRLTIAEVILCDREGGERTEFQMGEAMGVEVVCDSAESIPNARFNLGVVNARGPLFLANMLVDGASFNLTPGRNLLRCRFHSLPLMPGAYQIYGEIWGPQGDETLLHWSEWTRFRVRLPVDGSLPLAEAYSVTHLLADAPIFVPYVWQ